MREIRTFVLRLLVDSNEPDALRGVLRAVAGDEELFFADEETLVALLHQVGRPSEDAAAGSEKSAPTSEMANASHEQGSMP
jgi:hypothetical protein